MSSSVSELKAQIYDEIVKHQHAQKNIAILEQQLQQVIQSESQPVPVAAEKPEVEAHNNT